MELEDAGEHGVGALSPTGDKAPTFSELYLLFAVLLATALDFSAMPYREREADSCREEAELYGTCGQIEFLFTLGEEAPQGTAGEECY
ncbi:hypothetical protein ACIO13_26005 [Streptomyces sp. NPDC087425]|uniref:hypothetical protein n=1 Tax=unclassified Streptomyces TaxID=2593676 RepID=UPI0038078B74